MFSGIRCSLLRSGKVTLSKHRCGAPIAHLRRNYGTSSRIPQDSIYRSLRDIYDSNPKWRGYAWTVTTHSLWVLCMSFSFETLYLKPRRAKEALLVLSMAATDHTLDLADPKLVFFLLQNVETLLISSFKMTASDRAASSDELSAFLQKWVGQEGLDILAVASKDVLLIIRSGIHQDEPKCIVTDEMLWTIRRIHHVAFMRALDLAQDSMRLRSLSTYKWLYEWFREERKKDVKRREGENAYYSMIG